ncbi:MAG: dihydroorotate dehydrogenase electron transfer subunit [Oscillospiraceae bacterium]|nr:dihydroorotate dehydrogenase electron transfer subunit [Oscillospiraceae bacterium]
MKYSRAEIISNDKITEGIYSMKVTAETESVKPGQFYMLQPRGELLPRPISVCEIGGGWLEFCYAVVGAGTLEFSEMRVGDEINLTGPLGNGFDMDFINKHKRVAVVSGSIGIAPFIEVCKRLTCEYECFCGFHGESYLTYRFVGRNALGTPHTKIATDNGVEGHRGLVTELFDPKDFDLILACGSEGFSKAVAQMCVKANVPLLISMDRYMACGVGACLCCTCKTVNGNERCCADGPVFKGGELLW